MLPSPVSVELVDLVAVDGKAVAGQQGCEGLVVWVEGNLDNQPQHGLTHSTAAAGSAVAAQLVEEILDHQQLTRAGHLVIDILADREVQHP